MRTNTYNAMMREFVNMANTINRSRVPASYDYARNGGSSLANGNESVPRTVILPINAWVDDDVFYVTANLPGVNPEDVEITFEGDDLTIRGEYPAVNKGSEEGKIQFVRHELPSGRFERKIAFNVPVDADNIQASFENGMLELSIPKAEEAKPKQIKVLAK